MFHRARPCAICNLNLNLLLTTASICEPFPQLASFPLHSRPKYGCIFEKQSRAVAVYILCFCPSLIFIPCQAAATPQKWVCCFKASWGYWRISDWGFKFVPKLSFFFFFLHIISLRQVLLRVQLSCTYVNKPTKVSWRTGSLLLMRPSSKTRPSLRISQRHSCFSCVLPWNSVRPSPVKPRPTWKRSLFHFPAYRLRDVYVTVALSVLFQSSLPSTQIVLPMITSVWPHAPYHETPWNHPYDKQTVSKKPVCL